MIRTVLFSGAHPLSWVALAAVAEVAGIVVVGSASSDQPGPGHDPNTPGAIEWLAGLRPDLLVAAGYPKIFSHELLQVPALGALNAHPALLPDYRGSHPVFWAFYEGRREIGVTLYEMDHGLDTGSILSQRRLAIDPNEDPAAAYERLLPIALSALVDVFRQITKTGALRGAPQPPGGCHRGVPWRELERLEFDWTLPAAEIVRRSRAFAAWVNIAQKRQRVFVNSTTVATGSLEPPDPGRVVERTLDAVTVCAGDGKLVRLIGLRVRKDVRRGTSSKVRSLGLSFRLPPELDRAVTTKAPASQSSQSATLK